MEVSFSVGGMKRVEDKEFDVIIIGAGPGGLSAALYAARAKTKVLVIEKEAIPGGQIATTHLVEDYPGIESITGPEFGKLLASHAEKFGATIAYGEALRRLEKEGEGFKVSTSKAEYRAKTVILATGATWRELNIPGEREYRGKGVSYCGICDAPFFKDKEVIVVGGGNSALDEAPYIAKFARKVFLVHRRDEFRGDKILQERVFNTPNIEVVWNTEVKEIRGDGEKVTSVVLYNNKEGKEKEMQVEGVFIFIGTVPNTELFKGQLEMDERGYIITNEKMETNIEGVYAVGDCRKSPLKQAVTSAGEGAIAGHFASKRVEHEA